MKPLKRVFATTYVCLFVSSCLLYSQEKTVNEDFRRVYFGLKIGFGYTPANEINNYIDRYYPSEGFYIDSGSADIHLYFNADIHFSIFASRNIEIRPALEAAIGFSSVQDVDMIGMDNDRYNILSRLSPSLSCLYHLYVKNENSLYFGGGPAYNMNFLFVNDDDNKFRGKKVGLKISLGFMMRSTWNPMYFELDYNLAGTRAERRRTDDYNYFYVSGPEKLDFSGLNINFGINF